MNDSMKKTLDGFLAKNTLNSVDRNTYLVCGLEDNINKVTVCIVFVRDWHVDAESDEYKSTIVEGSGVVFIVPAYWLCIPKELALPFLTYMIDDYYQNELGIEGDSNNGNTGGSTGGTQGPGCGCPPGYPNSPGNCPIIR